MIESVDEIPGLPTDDLWKELQFALASIDMNDAATLRWAAALLSERAYRLEALDATED